jgi:uncharacterized membrane protein
MAGEPSSAENAPPTPEAQPEESVLSPPQGQAFIADTISTVTESGPAASTKPPVDTEALAAQGFRYLRQRQETRVHIGPIPDPETLRELVEIYPNAAKIIFDEFRAQSAHRRDMERAVITVRNTALLRGQYIGGALGMIGLIGSLVVAGLGYGWAGFGIAMGSLGSLVSIFVYGREAQKKERLEKEELRERIKKEEPIEKLEGANPPNRKGKPHVDDHTPA